ncbi:7537_t:CDS:2 [Racocetra fulgida]|uniref:RNA-dependent RNA polymerase n=1 Tax=Racocetra fulgida TaxID=60492 RepID=A0A9N9ALQ7_9GLOM|nr:7537_t:CDS:2 [Racocetra fulgida]
MSIYLNTNHSVNPKNSYNSKYNSNAASVNPKNSYNSKYNSNAASVNPNIKNSYSYNSNGVSVNSSSKNSFNEVVNERKRTIENLMSKYRMGEPFVTSSHEFYMEDLAFKDVRCLDDLINNFFEKSLSSGLSIDKNMFRQLQMDFEQDLHQQYTLFSLFEAETAGEDWNNVDVLSNNVEIPINFISNKLTTNHSPTDVNSIFWVPKGATNCSTKIPFEYESFLLNLPFLVWYEFVRLFKPFGKMHYSINVLNKLKNRKTGSEFYDAFESICKEYLMDSCRNYNGQELCKLIPYNKLIWEISETNKSVGKRKHIYYSADVTMRNGKLEMELNPPRSCQSKRYYRMLSSERFLHVKLNKEIDVEKIDDRRFSMLKNLLLQPLELAGRTYEFLYAREGTLYYFATYGSGLEPVKIWEAINSDVPINCNLNMTIAKFYSRVSLGFSDSNPAIVFDHNQIRYNEPDVENTIGQCLTDGCAAISLAAMREIAKIMDYKETPLFIQARIENGGVPVQVFIDMIKENVQKIRDMVVGQDDPTVLRAWIAKSENIFHRRIEERINNNDSDVNDYGSNISEVSTNSGLGGVSLSGFPDSPSEICIEMLDAGFTPSTCPFLAKKLKHLLKGQLKGMASRFHIETPLSRSLICVADPTNSLEQGEIFIQLDGEAGYDERGMRFGIIEGDVILSRNPCVLPSDIQKARAVNNPLLSKYYNVVIFPVKAQSREGPLAAKLSGGDYDGDKVFCCWDPRITELFENSPVAETLPEVENAFEKCKETVSEYLAPVKENIELCGKKIQELFLNEYFRDFLTPRGLYDYYHRLYSSHHGLSNPTSIYLAQVAARLLDATKQGETLKRSVLVADKKYSKIPIPPWMDKDKTDSNFKSVCIMDDIKRAVQEEIAFVNSPEFTVAPNAQLDAPDHHIQQFWLREYATASSMDDDRYKKDLELIISVTDSILRKYNYDVRGILGEDEKKVDPLFLNSNNQEPLPSYSVHSKNARIRAVSFKYTEEFTNLPPASCYQSDILKHVDRSDLNHDITLFELRLKAAALYIQAFTKNPESEGCWKIAFRVLCGLKARMLESEKSDIVGGPRTVVYEDVSTTMSTSTSTSQPFAGLGLDSLPISQERLSLLNRFKNERLGNIRPLNEFFDRDRLSKPANMGVIHDYVITQKHLYMGLFGVSIPLLWISSAGSTIFWIVVLGHAAVLEPGVEGGFAANV